MKKSTRVAALLMSTCLLLGGASLGSSAKDESDGYSHPNEPMSEYKTSGVSVYDDLSDYVVKTQVYTATAYETYPAMEVRLATYLDKDAFGEGLRNKKHDVIFYAINWHGERIGTESDTSILGDFISEGYAVVTVDFANNPDACSPNIEHTMARLRAYFMDGTSGFSGTGITVNASFSYFLPAGYRLARDVWFWNSYNYSSLGTRQSVVSAWNKCIAKGGSNTKSSHTYTADFSFEYDRVLSDGSIVEETVSHKKGEVAGTVTNVEECTQKDGSPLRYDCYLDILYPSEPTKALPVYLMQATNPDRPKNTCTNERCTFVGMTFNGYTTVMSDYSYIPMSLNAPEGYGYIDNYGTHGYNVMKVIQAAVRCVRYYAADYGYSGEYFGAAGISKGSPETAILSIKDNAKNAFEKSRYTADTEASAKYGVPFCYEGDMTSGSTRLTLNQPFLYDDVPYGPVLVDGRRQYDAYGNLITYEYYGAEGTGYIRNTGLEETDDGFRQKTGKSYADYKVTDSTEKISSECAAVYCAAGDGTKRLVETGDLANLEKIPMILSCGKFDEYNCFDYWYDLENWFIRSAKSPFLAITMLDQGHVYPTAADPNGYRRHDAFLRFFDHYLKPDETEPEFVYCLPNAGKENVPVKDTITVKFYDQMVPESLKYGLLVRNLTTGKVLAGEWIASEANTKFTFEKSADLISGCTYAVCITPRAKAVNGNTVAEERQFVFKTDGSVILNPVADATVFPDTPDKVDGTGSTLRVDADSVALASFPAASLKDAKKITLRLFGEGTKQTVKVKVYALPSFLVNETTTSYSSLPALTDDLALGTYDITGSEIALDLSALSSRDLGDYVTFAFVADANTETVYTFTYRMDFEDESEGKARRDQTKDNHMISDQLIAIGGSPKAYEIDATENATEGGSKSLRLTVQHSYDRIKFFNSMNSVAFTEADIGRTYSISFKVKTDHAGKIVVGLMSFNSGSSTSGYTGPASSYGTAFCGGSATVTTVADEWTEGSLDITVTSEMVKTQSGLLTFQCSSGKEGETRIMWLDDLLVEEIPSDATPKENPAGTAGVSTGISLISREGDTAKGMSLVVETEGETTPGATEIEKEQTMTVPDEPDEPFDPDSQVPVNETKTHNGLLTGLLIGAGILVVAAIAVVVILLRKKH